MIIVPVQMIFRCSIKLMVAQNAATTLDNVELKHQDEVEWIVRDTSNNEDTCSFTKS